MRAAILLLVMVLGFYAHLSADPLKVAAAANTQYAMDELAQAYFVETGEAIQVILSSSGKLTAQIQNGAPFDVFLSANLKYPEFLFQKGYAADKPRVYALGTLVIWTLSDKVKLNQNLGFLRENNIRKIAIANPRNAPYGVESIRAMDHAGVWLDVQDHLIFGESISQVNQYVFSKSAEVGFTSKSTVLAGNLSSKGHWIEVDKASYKPIFQGLVILRYGLKNNPEASKRFVKFILGPKGREVLSKFGYDLPTQQ